VIFKKRRVTRGAEERQFEFLYPAILVAESRRQIDRALDELSPFDANAGGSDNREASLTCPRQMGHPLSGRQMLPSAGIERN